MAEWSVSDMPSQRGRTAVVTGTGGLGLETALALAGAGAQVIIAGRNHGKGAVAVERIRQQHHAADVRFEALNLADLDSIDTFADRLRASLGKLDLLVNNAAVMAPPSPMKTEDGFELQFGTNYLSHFALTARLLPLLRNGDKPRVVTVSSIAARSGAIDFDDLQATRRYAPMPVYAQSKLACLMFALELQRRSDAGNWGIDSIAAHPGVSRTELILNGAGPRSLPGLVRRRLSFLFQPAAQGALPILYAVTSPSARGGGYYGPDRLMELRGFPAPASIPRQAIDTGVAATLWSVSERLARVAFPV